MAYGTIGAVIEHEHRVRLSDADVSLIVSALRARAAMTSGLRRHRLERLAARLAEMTPGNPKLTLGELEQTHEVSNSISITRQTLLTQTRAAHL